ncbi:CinA family protein [Microbacterium elymi]|uniref:CinA family protein n=1 Tax=Microbacterium elymi TaxID=2909587 RepID=A0ABY5NIV3_9MICO|nr:CinA family protein [Microbacterium elymi]UUT35095.1 CinA family protein [Microbacterium elymi]
MIGTPDGEPVQETREVAPDGREPLPEARELLNRLAARGWTIGVAESLTGGLLTASIVDVPGASTRLRGAVVAYATDLKHAILGVDAGLLAVHGPVHPDVARQMAVGVRGVTGQDGVPADVGVSTTGVAGPSASDGHPPGTVFIGVATPAGTSVVSLLLEGDRDAIRRETVRRALRAVVEAV